MDSLRAFTQLSKRQVLLQALNFVLVVASAVAMWRGLAVWSNCESPIVVVLSESMEPAFARGDLLFLTLGDDPIKINDITVFKIDGREIPIVHRVIRTHHTRDGKVYALTKGDNNQVDDRGLYATGQMWLEQRHFIGRVKAHVPYVGMVTIIMNDYPKLKYAVLAVLGGMVLLTRE